MTLKKYLSKRVPENTPEPMLSKQDPTSALRFCIQKHAARQLHYDFRLELEGVLLSWAIPKGPSLNPKVKRLAMKVEDHPLDYQYFEGTIPKGNYGAGTVEIWDSGFYRVPNTKTLKEAEANLKKGLQKGHLTIFLEGTKLQGEFGLLKLRSDKEDNSWLLIKKNDEYADFNEDIQKKSEDNPKKESKKETIPSFINPMLSTLVDKPFDDNDWLFEIKWDGFRAMAYIDKNKIQLLSRNKNSFNEKFPKIIHELSSFPDSLILDGEVVILDERGKSHFQLMQNYQKTGKGHLIYQVFDLLFLEGRDLRSLPLIQRKEILMNLLKKHTSPYIRYSDHILKKGIDFFKLAVKNQLEGIIGKKTLSSYQSKRSHDWIKVKVTNRQEVIIGGFTEPRGSRKKFGALLVGVYNANKKLIYCGHVGGGFNRALLEDIHNKLDPLIQPKCPFENTPIPNMPVKWVKPKLICEVKFAEWTEENLMRQPIFLGLREDKPPKTVKKEVKETIVPAKKESLKKSDAVLTHLDKIYWPKEQYTKGKLIEYYQQVSTIILPYLKDHPIMLHRYPEGIEKPGFYQKDISNAHPSQFKTAVVKHEGKSIEYLLINNLSTLSYAINLGTIDLHPFLASYKNLEYPDFCVIDLDPHDIDFKYLIDTALVLHEIMESCAIPHYCKTSGNKGLHICIPLHANYNFEQSRQFAEIIAMCAHQKLPKITSIERDPKKRPKKIYLDCLQNRFGQSLVSPYSVRPNPLAKVSTPLLWEEVDKNLNPADFTLETLPKRLKEKGDVFKPILGKGIHMQAKLKSLQKLLKS